MQVNAINAVSQAISHEMNNNSVSDKVNTFINEINQLGLDINNSVAGGSVIELQEYIDRYTTKVQAASKIANAVVKSINTLTNT